LHGLTQTALCGYIQLTSNRIEKK